MPRVTQQAKHDGSDYRGEGNLTADDRHLHLPDGRDAPEHGTDCQHVGPDPIEAGIHPLKLVFRLGHLLAVPSVAQRREDATDDHHRGP